MTYVSEWDSCVIFRTSDGQYVAKSGQKRSYTEKLQDAKVYRTKESAEKDACENERVVRISDTLLYDRIPE